ncbi:MAG: SDR family oxidoreductase, partial [Polyangiales bacterium]
AAAMQQAALIALARTAALEWRRQGIRVNALVPTAREAGTQEAPLFRAADSGALTPAQVAPVAAFLLSEPSTAISGEVVGIAGNRLYRLHHAQSPGLFSEAATWHPDDIAAQWLALSRQRGT